MEKKLQEEDPLLDDRVDINRAGKEELMTLTGVGETRHRRFLHIVRHMAAFQCGGADAGGRHQRKNI